MRVITFGAPGSRGGVLGTSSLVSQDSGLTWKRVVGGPAALAIDSVSTRGALYAAGWANGIYRLGAGATAKWVLLPYPS